MSHANEERMAAGGMNQQSESIRISQFWEEELKALPYLSRRSLNFSFAPMKLLAQPSSLVLFYSASPYI